ncbi:MAG: ABC transporter permease subunit [candidate division Zixibacteria bacterium]|nr:ABC transporter permease subunit [candidate division Zixibacteria bacterium]
MLTYFIRRVFTAILTLIIAAFAVSMLIYLVPGDPVDAMMGDSSSFVSPERVEEIRSQLGLDKPVYLQFPFFMANVLRGDMGRTIFGNEPVLPLLLSKLPNTLILAFAGLAVAILIGVPLGYIAAYQKGKFLDSILMLGATLGISMPVFWLGLMLLVLFSMMLGIFPVAGSGFGSLVLPAFTSGVIAAATIARMARSTMVEILQEDYIRSARAKGLSERIVLMRHAVKPSLVGVVGMIAHMFTWMLGGQIIIENVFAWDGLGQLAVSALLNREYNLIQGYILIYSTMVVTISVVLDLIYAGLDPRIRYE